MTPTTASATTAYIENRSASGKRGRALSRATFDRSRDGRSPRELLCTIALELRAIAATGGNPANNAIVTDGAIVAGGSRVVQSRQHLA